MAVSELRDDVTEFLSSWGCIDALVSQEETQQVVADLAAAFDLGRRDKPLWAGLDKPEFFGVKWPTAWWSVPYLAPRSGFVLLQNFEGHVLIRYKDSVMLRSVLGETYTEWYVFDGQYDSLIVLNDHDVLILVGEPERRFLLHSLGGAPPFVSRKTALPSL